MVDALIFRPYPVPHPGDVVTLVSTSRDNSFDYFSYREYLDIRGHDEELRRRDRERRRLAAASASAPNPGATPRVKGGMLVSGNYFRVLGVEPQLGRGFRDDEDEVPGRDAVVVLGPDFWKHEFASDPAVVGRTIRLNGTDFTVDRRRAGDVPGHADLLAPRLLHAAGDGAGVLDRTRRRTSSRTATIAS